MKTESSHDALFINELIRLAAYADPSCTLWLGCSSNWSLCSIKDTAASLPAAASVANWLAGTKWVVSEVLYPAKSLSTVEPGLLKYTRQEMPALSSNVKMVGLVSIVIA